MSHSIQISIVGATGNVGSTLLKTLADDGFPANQLVLLASEQSVGKKILYLNQELLVQSLSQFDFSNTQLAFFAAGGEVAKRYAPAAANAGCYVIDKSSYYRLCKEVPLIIPEVNGEVLRSSCSKIISVPNCSTIQLVMALKPIQNLTPLERVDIATYQAISGAGQKATRQLQDEIASYQREGQNAPAECLKRRDTVPFAFNVIPSIDSFLPSGFTKEEAKLHEETRRILSSAVLINATAVRVPVWQGHSEAVHLKTVKPVGLEVAKHALKNFPGIHYCDQEMPTPMTHAQNNPTVWIGRLRRHPEDSSCYLNFWIVSDNLYKGAAWNALQIGKMLFPIDLG